MVVTTQICMVKPTSKISTLAVESCNLKKHISKNVRFSIFFVLRTKRRGKGRDEKKKKEIEEDKCTNEIRTEGRIHVRPSSV